jgi:hypothetical protein
LAPQFPICLLLLAVRSVAGVVVLCWWWPSLSSSAGETCWLHAMRVLERRRGEVEGSVSSVGGRAESRQGGHTGGRALTVVARE